MTTDLRAIHDTECLEAFHQAGVLGLPDVHVTARLARLGRETSPLVLLAAALTVRAARLGAVCVPLADLANVTTDIEGVDVTALPWPGPADLEAALRASTLTTPATAGQFAPLRLADTSDGPLLYLDRYFRQELTIRDNLISRAAQPRPPVDAEALQAILDGLFRDPAGPDRPAAAPDRQRIAAALAATEWTTFITGGPGTGKTYTVARILAALHRLDPARTPRIALAAPTGKAAARLTESINNARPGDMDEQAAVTVHRLLGWRRGGEGRFAYHGGNRLPFDVIIIDETSMLSLTMTARLLDAIAPTTRLVFLGDPDQLASVDAGAVLADIIASTAVPPPDAATAVPGPVVAAVVAADLAEPSTGDRADVGLSAAERARLGTGRIRLTRGRRYGGAIADLAVALRAGDTDRVLEVLAAGGPELSWAQPHELDGVRADIVSSGHAMLKAAVAGRTVDALDALGRHRLLCAHRSGPSGVTYWDAVAQDWIHLTVLPGDGGGWFAGQPLLVTGNDYDTGVFNGDTGVIMAGPDGSLTAAFERGSHPVLVPTSRLSSVQTAYAMTIHRAQGSQYQRVSVLLPPPSSALLSRQLLYTAVTRGIEHVRVIGTCESVVAAVARQVPRASGLRSTLLGVTGEDTPG